MSISAREVRPLIAKRRLGMPFSSALKLPMNSQEIYCVIMP